MVPFPPRFGSPIEEVRCGFFVVTASMSMNLSSHICFMYGIFTDIFIYIYHIATIHVGKFTIHHGISGSFKRYKPYFEGLEPSFFVGTWGPKVFSVNLTCPHVITWSTSRWCFNGVRE